MFLVWNVNVHNVCREVCTVRQNLGVLYIVWGVCGIHGTLLRTFFKYFEPILNSLISEL